MNIKEAIEKFYEEATEAVNHAEAQCFTTKDELITVILQNLAEIRDKLINTL